MIAEHGRGRGSLAASSLAGCGNGHILDGEQAALQDTWQTLAASPGREPDETGGEVWRPPPGLARPAAAAVMAFSRVFVGVHYPHDMAAGVRAGRGGGAAGGGRAAEEQHPRVVPRIRSGWGGRRSEDTDARRPGSR
ncbi:hypothetical protein ABZ801_02550 [Actinomadura sp. NPDC047616]|uniref:hypothetical protein n=1 Tax=Actinomadura sp. NPDC047616 TaxID=3155914 RepID=UPI0033C511F4